MNFVIAIDYVSQANKCTMYSSTLFIFKICCCLLDLTKLNGTKIIATVRIYAPGNMTLFFCIINIICEYSSNESGHSSYSIISMTNFTMMHVFVLSTV